MNEQEVREFEENIVKGANIAFQRLVNQKKKEDGELVFSRNGHIFRVKAVVVGPQSYLANEADRLWVAVYDGFSRM
ncbi:hypothetical protein, partial [Parabacteroides distasonis]|uniref:hypothetical protein n=1 Tax=Parabacteroides distasonis TaxID=823 RepID=UPI00325B825C